MDENGFDSINVVPLVDVMLVLLTIVLTTSTFIAAGVIPVDLPKAANSTNTSKEGGIIEIDSKGSLFLDGKSVSIQEFKIELSDLDRTSPILIRADKSIKLQVFVQVMDIVKGYGFRKVSLQTETN